MHVEQLKKGLLVQVAPWLFVLLWSSGFIAAKYTVLRAPPFKLLFLRGLFSALVFLALALAMRVKFPSLKGAASQFRVGLLLQGAFLGGCFFAMSHGMPAGLVALVTGLQPLLTAAYSALLKGQRMTLGKWAGVLLGFVGVFLVLSPTSHQLSFGVVALAGAVAALMGVTAGTVVQNQVKPDGHIVASTVFQYVALALSAGLVSLFTETSPVAWSAEFAAGLAWMVVGVSTVAMLLLLFMLRRGEATTVASYFYLVPVVTTLMAWLIFGEPLTAGVLMGMAVTIAGMLLVLRSPSTRRPQSRSASKESS